MNLIEKIVQDIESIDFAARLNVVSSSRSFFDSIVEEPEVISLQQSMKESDEVCNIVLRRIELLSKLEINQLYENPNDIPLAVFLWLLLSVKSKYSSMAVSLVSKTPKCWYARKLI